MCFYLKIYRAVIFHVLFRRWRYCHWIANNLFVVYLLSPSVTCSHTHAHDSILCWKHFSSNRELNFNATIMYKLEENECSICVWVCEHWTPYSHTVQNKQRKQKSIQLIRYLNGNIKNNIQKSAYNTYTTMIL